MSVVSHLLPVYLDNVEQRSSTFLVDRVVRGLCGLLLWRSLRILFSAPLFKIFLEYAKQKNFTDEWSGHARRFICIQTLLFAIAVVFLVHDYIHLYTAEGGSNIWEISAHVGDITVMLMLMMTSTVLLTLFKFAQITVYVLTSEVMESTDLMTVCGTWSVYIVLTRSLSQACSKLFLMLTSLATVLGMLLVYSVVVDRSVSIFHVGFMGITVIACLMPLISAAGIRENALQAISLINMIDFTDGQNEIDHNKATCIQYLQASDIGFRVANQAVSMGLAIKVGYILMACVLTVSLKMSGG